MIHHQHHKPPGPVVEVHSESTLSNVTIHGASIWVRPGVSKVEISNVTVHEHPGFLTRIARWIKSKF